MRTPKLAIAGALAALAAAAPAAMPPLANAKTAAPKNVNFVGTWTPNSGVAWTITRENRRTGACVGYSALKSSGYKLVGCRITGHRYRFTITYGGYKSVNTGTIRGNRLSGSFNDGSAHPYTATRARAAR
jgi:hypothetical protein